MKTGIITIGSELTSGGIQDANTALIAREFHRRGWQVAATMSVSDDETMIKKALDFILPLTDAVVITGGLGPTADDITTAAVARAFNLSLYADEDVLNHIKTIFAKYGLKWTENNAKQAVFPQGAQILANPVGTAAGFSLMINGKVLAVIPGVPAEVRKMLPEAVLPLLYRSFPQETQYLAVRTLKLFGISEAAVDQSMAGIDLPGVDVGFYPRFPENHLVLSARDTLADTAWFRVNKAAAEVHKSLGPYVFADDEETLEGVVAGLLKEQGRTVSVAESCTGGLITDRLTDIPGSSMYLERGLVTYSNRSKTDLLGVPETVLQKHGAVSEETARLMAEGVRKLAGTDLGLATTGIAGPDGGSEAKPVGTVFIAIADGAATICRKFSYHWERRRIKIVASQAALIMLKRYLTGEATHEGK
ncbi:MAG: nicotinamide-nucleotide amidase [Thermodesulfobacteriota bacterium]|nr:nicotinamide-nucleotide amidase [Thermodesulfobacteriota bacterium]